MRRVGKVPRRAIIWWLSAVLVLAAAGCGSFARDRPSDPPSSMRSQTAPDRPGRAGVTSGRPGSAPVSTVKAPRTTPATSWQPDRGQLTGQRLWWAVDSTVAIDARSRANVRGYYRGGHDPLAWGRYLLGRFGMHRAEIGFAARHHIAVYLLVPDANCSGCAGGDLCGNDRSAGQAVRDAQQAIAAARRLSIPAGVTLYKDVEEVGACHGELTGSYLDTWFQRLRHSRYRAGFYGNATAQDYDFPRAYCAAARRDSTFRREVILAQDEPEPMIGAPRGTIGPRNAPRFTPDRPSCAAQGVTKIWQYGESLSSDNLTDVDEIRPDTPGLLMPDGSVTSPS